MSDQHKIKFLDDETSSEEVVQSEDTPKKTLDQIAEEQKAKKISNKNDKYKTVQHISSARTGSILDMGGPSKYVKSESSNTIWDSDKNSKVSKEMDSKTKTIQEKAGIASNRREAEDKRMNDLVENIKSTIQGSASTISSAGTLSGTNYKVSENNMSIFDSKDFARVKDQTGGEKVSEEIKNKKEQVDNSWRNGGKSFSSKDVTNRMFDGFFMKSE